MSLIEDYQAYHAKRATQGPDVFFTGFDGGINKETYFRRSIWNWNANIAPYIIDHLPEGRRQAILDLGYGGGGMLFAAAQMFETAYGLDVHRETHNVYAALNLANIELKLGDGKTIPWPADCFDCIYSCVTFLHFDTIQVASGYLWEIWRTLRVASLAIVYYNPIHNVQWLEVPQQSVNYCSLRINPTYFQELAEGIGFDVCDHVRSMRKTTPGGQAGLILKKGEKQYGTDHS